ncbi:MAG: succinyl-diaminopimelate desuccinylase [Candidatus Puniceispirillaceae bacterium]
MDRTSQAVLLAQRLVQCPSVTPREGGALDLLEAELTAMGCACTRLPFGEAEERVDNLFARWGTGGPHFAFAGHTDVVPPGDTAAWTHDPFSGEIVDGRLHGRGAADMKGGVAAFVAATARFLETPPQQGSISFLITGDEEGDAINGTTRMVDWVRDNDQVPDMCLVGEPTNVSEMGDVIKNGRRGSLSCKLTVTGIQGHVAYPHLADNPLTHLLAMLAPVNGCELDGGTEFFDPSTANVTSIDVGNKAGNVIPASATAQFNIRFNTEHSADSLIGWLEEHFDRVGGTWEAHWKATAHPFLTPPGQLTDMIADATEKIVGRRPKLSTNGGTSDARFITNICPVAEFGLVGRTMHKIDEQVAVEDIQSLTDIYTHILNLFFEQVR